MRINKMQAGSKYTARLPQGCRSCRQGAKLVLLVTGKCDTGCFYCPLSSEKRGRSVTFADEARVTKDEDVIDEARSIGAKGTGITGGDPLKAMDLTLRYIRLLKMHLRRGASHPFVHLDHRPEGVPPAAGGRTGRAAHPSPLRAVVGSGEDRPGRCLEGDPNGRRHRDPRHPRDGGCGREADPLCGQDRPGFRQPQRAGVLGDELPSDAKERHRHRQRRALLRRRKRGAGHSHDAFGCEDPHTLLLVWLQGLGAAQQPLEEEGEARRPAERPDDLGGNAAQRGDRRT